MTVAIAFKLRCVILFNISFHYFKLQPKSDLEMLISPVLFRNNRRVSLYKFKVYGMMVWSTYIVKWLPQHIQLTPISHKDTKKRNENSKKFLLLELFVFFYLITERVQLLITSLQFSFPLPSTSGLISFSPWVWTFCFSFCFVIILDTNLNEII